MKKVEKELLGLAGEYAVASELCRRGLYSQLTLGSHKQTDILVETKLQMFRISVKAKQGAEWPAISGLYRDNDFLILVDFQNKQDTERPDFYILNFDDWKDLVMKEKVKYPSIKVDEQFRITYSDGWKGLNIRNKHVDTYKEGWAKLITQYKDSLTESQYIDV